MELGDIDKYDDDTIYHANQAFFLWEDRNESGLREHLAIAVDGNYSYCFGKYAILLLEDPAPDYRTAADLLLRGILRGNECSQDYLDFIGFQRTYFWGAMENILTKDIVAWLRNENVSSDITFVVDTCAKKLKDLIKK